MSSISSILLIAAAAWLVLAIGKRAIHGAVKWVPLTVLGVLSVGAGLALFHVRHDDELVSARAAHWDFQDPVGQVEWRDAEDDAPFLGNDGLNMPLGGKHVHLPKWVMISLATVLVISGALLTGRGRTRPAALKAFTVLGLAASGFALVSFFSTPPHYRGHSGDRVVKNEHGMQLIAAAEDEETPRPSRAKKPKRTSRAKKPSVRREADDPQGIFQELPPRAGEIPVAVELFNEVIVDSAPKPAEAPEPPAPVEPPVAVEPPAAATPPAESPPVAPAEPDAPAPPSARLPDEQPAAAPAVVLPATNGPPAAPPVVSPPLASPPDRPSPDRPSADRPAWVDEFGGRLVKSIYSTTAHSGLYTTVPECQRALNHEIKREADHYIDDYLGEGASTIVKIPLPYVIKHIKRAEHGEIVRSESVGPMQQIHALLEFDDDARADFQRLWHQAVVTNRLLYAGSGAALVMALLATFYGYLKLDLRTSGAHSGRLQLAASLVALILAAGALLVRRAVPF